MENKANYKDKPFNRPHKATQTTVKPLKPTLPKANVKVYSLGGVGVIGMNMYVVEQNDELLIMDAGILFADDDIHGVNYIIPDFSYLKEKEDKIIGLFITHGHEDHIGAIPFLLEKVKIPVIYACGLAVGLIKNKMDEFPNIEYNLKNYYEDSIFKYQNFEVSFFRTNHSIPDSFGIAIKTNLGYVVNTGDFKFDFNPVGKMSDYFKMTKLGEEGVYCLLSESTNANITQFSSSERKIGETLMNIFEQIKGRVIVATFASNVYRVEQIIKASIACNRKIIVFGHSMETTIRVASKMHYIDIPKGWIISSRDIKKLDENDINVTILCTGSQGEPMAALSRIASGTHKQIKLLKDDTIIYSSKPIPGNEQFINRNINKLVHAGAHVIVNGLLSDTHTTGHASENELKMMLAFMRPKYFIPVHGEYMMLKKHVEIANSLGIPKENCFVLKPGDVVCLSKTKAEVVKKGVPASDIYLDASLSDVGSKVLKERKMLANDGLVSVFLVVNKKKELVTAPVVITKGYTTPANEASINNSIKQKVTDIYNHQAPALNKQNRLIIQKNITLSLLQYLQAKTDKKPLIVIDIQFTA